MKSVRVEAKEVQCGVQAWCVNRPDSRVSAAPRSPGTGDPGRPADPLEAGAPGQGLVGLQRHWRVPGQGTGAPEARAGPGKEGAGFFARSCDILCQRIILRYRVIERCREEFPVRLMCRCLRVSVSGFFDWSKRLPSACSTASASCTRTAGARWAWVACTKTLPIKASQPA